MGTVVILVIGLGVTLAVVLLIRLFGAWMFRIDEVIKYQKEILSELRKVNDINGKDDFV